MTDLLTRPLEEQRPDEAATGIRTATWGKIIVLALVIGLVGWLAFTSGDSSRAALEQARWQQVIDYHERQYQTMTDAQARTEAAYWDDVINHYARQYELTANATEKPATDKQSAHWEAVVDYYEQRWQLREQ